MTGPLPALVDLENRLIWLYMTVSVGVTERPYNGGWDLPQNWARRGGNVTERYVHDFGGHFAAYETPDILQDMATPGDVSVSGTGEVPNKGA